MTWNISPIIHNCAGRAAEQARKNDDEFFAAHQRQVWHARPLHDGESPVVDGVHAAGGRMRGYVIVIDPTRAEDRRASASRVVYPVVIRDGEPEKTRRTLSDVAQRLVKWFRKHSTTPPASRGQGIVVQGRAR